MFRSRAMLFGVLFLVGGLGFTPRRCLPQEKDEAGSATSPFAQAVTASEKSPEAEVRLKTEELRFLLMSRYPRMPYKLDSVTADGSVRIRVQIPERIARDVARSGISAIVGVAMLSQLTEGYYLGLSGLPASERMMVFEAI